MKIAGNLYQELPNKEKTREKGNFQNLHHLHHQIPAVRNQKGGEKFQDQEKKGVRNKEKGIDRAHQKEWIKEGVATDNA